jgi:hypothetical protein
MMRRSAIVAVSLVLLVVAAVVFSASGYVVILKSGQKIRAREAMRIEGNLAIITLSTGTVASYPLQLVDLIETERYNQQGLGDALLIEELTVGATPIPTATPRRPLGDHVTITAQSLNPELGSTAPPTPTPTPGIKLQARAYHDARVDQAFTKIFDDRKVFLYRTSAGTRPDYYFVRTTTDSEREVFKALQVVAEAFAIIYKLHPDISPAAIELEMVQTSGRAAGTFRILPEQAESIASGKVSVQQFYVDNVIF